jgi:hypothetical protein
VKRDDGSGVDRRQWALLGERGQRGDNEERQHQQRTHRVPPFSC